MFNSPPSSACIARDPLIRSDEARRQIVQAEMHLRRMVTRIQAASKAGHDRKARTLVSAFFKSRQAKIASMHHANTHRRRSKDRLHSEAWIIRAAETMSVWHPCCEQAHVFGKKKHGGGTRTLISFGLYGRARQFMVAQALRALHMHRFADWQYGVSRGSEHGRDGCIQSLSDKIKSSKAKYFAEIDIDNFFGSIDAMSLAKEVGLPTKVIRYVLCSNAYTYRLCKSNSNTDRTTLLENCRRGIPQGSSASSIVGALVVGKLMGGRDVRFLVNYVDNFAVIGESREHVAEQTSDLHAAICGGPYGTFGLSHVQERSIDEEEGFDFLGYHCEYDWLGVLQFEPSDRSFDRRVKELIKTAKEMRREQEKPKTVRNTLMKSIECWLAGFKLSTSYKHRGSLVGLVDYMVTSRIDKVPISDICDRSDKRLARQRRWSSDKSNFSILLADR